jgi:hypothetical protein
METEMVGISLSGREIFKRIPLEFIKVESFE